MRLRTRFGVFFYTLALTAVCSAQISPPESWHRLSVGGFELLTTDTEEQARETLRALQNADSLFRRIGLLPNQQLDPVRIFAFRTKAEFADFRLNSGAFGHYIHSRRGDFIVLEDIRPQHREAGVHEYTHVALRRAGLKLPVWLNEGLADVYSSFIPEASQVTLGGPLDARARALDRHSWLDLDALLAMPNEQLLYQQRDQISIFYGQSWALTHMLLFGEHYGHKFPAFLKAVSSGLSSADAFTAVYGCDVSTVAADLQRYWLGKQIRPVKLDVHLDAPAEPATKTLTAFESEVELANLLAAAPSTARKAENLLLGLLQKSPNDPQVREQLAELTRHYSLTAAPVTAAMDESLAPGSLGGQ